MKFIPRPAQTIMRFRICMVMAIVAIMVFVIFPFSMQHVYAAPSFTPPSMRSGYPQTAPYGAFFSSPALADLDKDGRKEIISADTTGCVWAYRDNGQAVAGFPIKTGGVCDNAPRIRGPVAIGDIDNDGFPDIVVGTRGSSDLSTYGRVFAYRRDGSLIAGFPVNLDWQNVTTNNVPEVQAVALADVDGDTSLDILAVSSNESGYETTSGKNVFAWNRFGQRLQGFPQGGKRGGGIFGQLAVGDLDADGKADLLIGRDEMYVALYQAGGTQKAGFPVSTYYDLTQTTWGVGKYIEFTQSAGAFGDVDGDGTTDIVIAGKVRDPLISSSHPTIGDTTLVLNQNGTRKSGWILPPISSSPLNTSFQSNHPVTLGDVDNDGKLEIFVTYNDGTVRAYRANGSSVWTKNITNGKTILASEVILADVTGDGSAEALFTTYSPDGAATAQTGLYAVDALTGTTITGYPLAFPSDSLAGSRGGSMAAPSVADLDGDGMLEIVVHTLGGVIYTWNTNQPLTTILWSTSRANTYRSGVAIPPRPTSQPTATTAPTSQPTATTAPTSQPTATTAPTSQPTATTAPTSQPTATTAPTSQPTATTAPTSQPTATTAPIAQSITRLVLVNADTDQDIRVLVSGATLDLAILPTKNINIRAETNPATVGSVKFAWDTTTLIENQAVYALAGNTGNDYKPWTPANGTHQLSVTPYSLSGAKGTAGNTFSISLTVLNSPGATKLTQLSAYMIFVPLVAS